MLAGLSVLVAILAAAPWWMPPWMLFIASGALAKGMAALGLMLLLRGGLVSFGHALYFGIGAYAAGLLVLSGITEFLVLAVLGTLATLVLALILGAFVSRYRGIFFGLLSMALSMVFYGLLIKLQSLGSSDGFNLGGIHLLSIPMQGTAGQVPTYLMTLVLSVLAAIGIDKFLRSRYGLLTKAL
jgi:branched-chain amino acid transport system permease protein